MPSRKVPPAIEDFTPPLRTIWGGVYWTRPVRRDALKCEPDGCEYHRDCQIAVMTGWPVACEAPLPYELEV